MELYRKPSGKVVLEVLLYMCCFYWLMNKTAFGQYPNRVKPGRKSEHRCGERVGRVRNKTCSLHRSQMLLPGPGVIRNFTSTL